MSRGQDNFQNPKQYILEQLFIYDYNNQEHKDILKLKIWVLDGVLTDEEISLGLNDIDVNNPKDHYSWLRNELTFLDKYIRTKDHQLEQDEEDFETFKQQRINIFNNFINTINPETNELYKDYEQDYLSRPTKLSNNDFEELYQAFKIKQNNGELNKASDIIDKITPDNNDNEKKIQESSINALPTPQETESNLKDTANKEAERNDKLYVKLMNEYLTEAYNIITASFSSVNIDLSSYIKYSSTTDPNTGEVTQGDPIQNPNYDPSQPISFNNYPYELNIDDFDLLLFNFPQKRVNPNTQSKDSTHKGSIQAGEGYRFLVYTYNTNIDSLSINEDFMNVYNTDKNKIQNLDNTYLINEVELNFTNFIIATFIKQTDSTTGEVSYVLNKIFDVNNLLSGVNQKGSISKERFLELNERWSNLNNLRENKIMQTGTRIILESMASAEVPDLKPDMINHLNDKKKEKEKHIAYLKENCPEFQ